MIIPLRGTGYEMKSFLLQDDHLQADSAVGADPIVMILQKSLKLSLNAGNIY